jgi:hypothetical protein
MVDSVTTHRRHAAARTAILALASLAATAAPVRAADLRDPMRPPIAQRPPAPPASVAPAASAPLLQSILIGGGRKPTAIIDGHVVELGGMHEKMRLSQLTENHAVLTGAAGRTELQLTPGVIKLEPGAAAVAALSPASAARHRARPSAVTVSVAEQK